MAPPVVAAKRAAPPVVAAKRAAPPVVAAKRAAPSPQLPDEPMVATWRDCMHYLPAGLRMAMGSCEVQVRLEQQAGEDYASVEPPTPLAAPQVNGRRNIGCGWWPTGSDANRDCAIRGSALQIAAGVGGR